MKNQYPSEVKAIVIGGGVVGCSVAYHLALQGWKEVILLERRSLCCGTTWHAAGLIGQLRSSKNLMKLAHYTSQLYQELEKNTDSNLGYKQNGSLSLALNDERYEELLRSASMAKLCDIKVDILSPKQCYEKYPFIEVNDVKAGFFIPEDGQIDPVNVTQMLAKAARKLGVKIYENAEVSAVKCDDNQVEGVWLENEFIKTRYVVNCAGMWAYELGKMVNVNIPLHACEHFYVVTEPIKDLPADLPVLRVPDECAYYKEDAGKILLGAFEHKAKAWGTEGIPKDFCFDQLPEDFEHFEPILTQAIERFPSLEKTGIHSFFNGPESFTPDNRYILGEAPNLKNYYVAAGFNSIGIQSAGGAGMALAKWMQDDKPPFDLWDVDIRRMQDFQASKVYLKNRVTEIPGLLYDIHYPYRQYTSSRGIRRTPLHERLAQHGACFGELAGWERPQWFLPKSEADKGKKPHYIYSWQRQNWFDYAGDEHMAVRNECALFDLSSFTKIRVAGKDAMPFMQKICAANVDVAIGRIVYTQWLNRNGAIEADLTVTRLESDVYLVVSGPASAQRDWCWLHRHLPFDANVVITDVTALEAVIAIMGPKSRELLRPLASQSIEHVDLRFSRAQTMYLSDVKVRLHRLSYVGELGFEIYVSSDMAVRLFDILTTDTPKGSIKLAGMHTLDACRLEKAFRHFGHDLTDEDHILESGLSFAVSSSKPDMRYGSFIGKQAVQEYKRKDLRRCLLQFKLRDSLPLIYHYEPIWRDNVIAGYITSGNYGHYLGSAVGLGYIEVEKGESDEQILDSVYEIEIATKRYEAIASLKPFYDPNSKNMRS